MKILMLCSPQGNQIALANKLHQKFQLSSIIICTGIDSKKKTIKSVILRLRQALGTILSLSLHRRTWFAMLDYYRKKYSDFPIPASLSTKDINDDAVIDFIRKEKPNLVVVSGTNLLKKKLIKAIAEGNGKTLNLHTGISPYIKGGPNCTNWCLYLKDFDLIGNTIMWLDEGIDSGNIISTERTPLTGKESLLDLHIKVMNHGHDLYLRSIEGFVNGDNIPNVPQNSLGSARLYLSKEWGPKQMIISLLNFYLFFKPGSKYFGRNKDFKLVAL